MITANNKYVYYIAGSLEIDFVTNLSGSTVFEGMMTWNLESLNFSIVLIRLG